MLTIITQPGFGIYNKENGPPTVDEIFHKPMCGTPHTGGNWCKKCRDNGHYSWLGVGDKCEVCKEKGLTMEEETTLKPKKLVTITIKGIRYNIDEAKEIYETLKGFFCIKEKTPLKYKDIVSALGGTRGAQKLYNCCLRNNIITIEDLSNLTARKFLMLNGVGRRTLRVAKEYLYKLDIKYIETTLFK